MGFARAVVVLVAALAFAQPAAAALAPGVFVSPGSPAGKEYSFPLSVLRGQAAGQAASGNTAAPLFGVGINPARRAGTAARTARGRQTSAAAGRHRRYGGRSHTGTATTAQQRQRDIELASLVHPSSDVPQIALIAVVLLVVAIGSGAVIAATRRRN